MEKAVAVFDLEGTLFKRSGNFLHEIRNSRKREVMSRVRVATFDITLMMIIICYRTGLVKKHWGLWQIDSCIYRARYTISVNGIAARVFREAWKGLQKN